MHNNVLLATTNGYMFVNGKLMAYEFQFAVVNFSSGEVEYTCMLGGKQEKMTLTSCPEIYADETHFQQGMTVTPKNLLWLEAMRSAFFYCTNSDGEDTYVYAIENNKVVPTHAPLDGFIYTKKGGASHPASGQYYASRDEALLHCDLIVVDEKGQETTTLSPAKRVALTDEQKEAVEALEMALKRLNEVGVTLCIDTDSDDLYAFSDKDVKERTWDGCRNEVICNYGYGINDLMTKVRYGSVLGWCFSDTTMYVKFKD